MGVSASGLYNLGNTCFLNSVMQCLYHTKLLKDYFVEDFDKIHQLSTTSRGSKRNIKDSLAVAFSELLFSMEEDPAVYPVNFKNHVDKFTPRFSGNNQEDAHEFLIYLLNGLHEDINRTEPTKHAFHFPDVNEKLDDVSKSKEMWRRYSLHNDSRITELFVGQLKSTLVCTTCQHQSITFDPFWDLSLPIPLLDKPVPIQICLEHFTKPILLKGQNRPTCSNCKKKRSSYKTLTLYIIPQILVLHLKRFNNEEGSKITNRVEFPLEGLDMSDFSSFSHCPKYDLYAVSNHYGTTTAGHYTAYCKNETAKWRELNDNKVCSIQDKDVVTDGAYILFYEMHKY